MKKLKYLLILSLIAVLAVGVLVGCQSQYEVDREHTYKITYCANGGRIKGKTERYIYLNHTVKDQNGNWRAVTPLYAPEPSAQGLIDPPTREGYKFAGWARGKVDSDGNPVMLTENNMSKRDRTDGGVYINDDGAVDFDTAREYKEYIKAQEDGTAENDEELTETERNENKSKQAIFATMRLEYYDYDRNNLWIFKADKVESDIVLVAVWERFNKFMLVNEEREGSKFEFDKAEDIEVLTDEEFVFDEADEKCGETYKKYEKRITDVAATNLLTESVLLEKYASFKDRNADYTPIRFYLDPEHTQPLTFPYEVTKNFTLIYCEEIAGKYTVVRENPGDFIEALNNNRNIYIEPIDHNSNDRVLDLTGRKLSIGTSTYSGTIIGNNFTIKGITSAITQSMAKYMPNEMNIYGGFFGDLDGAKISDLTLEYSFSFEIAIDPNDSSAKPADKMCDVCAFARTMNNTTLSNVRVNVVYTVTRSQVPGPDGEIVNDQMVYPFVDNDYDVTFNLINGWAAKAGFNNTVTSDCSIAALPSAK